MDDGSVTPKFVIAASASPSHGSAENMEDTSKDNISLSIHHVSSAKAYEEIISCFERYLDYRELELTKDPFVAPPKPHRDHPFTDSFRLQVIEWMYEISQDACVQNIILHSSIHLLDAVAPFVYYDSHDSFRLVQLVAICSINIMQKIHADYSDLFQQVNRAVDGLFGLEMCEWIEMVIMKLTRPGLGQPTAMGFVQLYTKIVSVARRTGWLMTYLADLVLVHGREFRRFRFCITAAAIYVIAVGTINQRDGLEIDPWPHDLAKFSRIDFDGLTGELLIEAVHDVHQLQKDFIVPEQGLLPSNFLKKYRSVSALGVASYPVMTRPFLTDMLDNLKQRASVRRKEVQSHLNEPDNLHMRGEPHGPSPTQALPSGKPGSGSKGRYFSNPANSQTSATKKQRLSSSEIMNFN